MKSFLLLIKKGELFLNIDVENQLILNHHFYKKLSAVDKMEDRRRSLYPMPAIRNASCMEAFFPIRQ